MLSRTSVPFRLSSIGYSIDFPPFRSLYSLAFASYASSDDSGDPPPLRKPPDLPVLRCVSFFHFRSLTHSSFWCTRKSDIIFTYCLQECLYGPSAFLLVRPTALRTPRPPPFVCPPLVPLRPPPQPVEHPRAPSAGSAPPGSVWLRPGCSPPPLSPA